MELLKLNLGDGLEVERVVSPTKLADFQLSGESGKERHLEDLLVEEPGLLNIGNYQPNGPTDLVIIAQQPVTQQRKKADLFALHKSGALVVVEVKRDSNDQANRNEGMNFQALRYAAASRTMSSRDVVNQFVDFLLKQNEVELPDDPAAYAHKRGKWWNQAIATLAEHFGDEDEELLEDDVLQIINPRERQKIYLVAASFHEEVTATAAWLREHEIEVYCFRLQPYLLHREAYINRERLIPPPELDQFYLGMQSPAFAPSQHNTPSTRRASDKPTNMTWSDGADESSVSVNSWRETLQLGLQRLVSEGAAPEDLPEGLKIKRYDDEDVVPREWGLLCDDVYFYKYFSADQVRKYLSDVIRTLPTEKPEDYLTIQTQSGRQHSLPGED